MRFASAAISCGLAASALGAQSAGPIRHPPWTFINAGGYGALGFGVGLGVGVVASPNSINPNSVVGSILLFTTTGAIGGGKIGRRASEVLDRGQPLSRGHRNAVVVGSLLFGGVGSLASVPLIAGEEVDTPLGSDAEAYAICALGGMAVTAILMATKWNNIPVRGLRLVPSIRLR